MYIVILYFTEPNTFLDSKRLFSNLSGGVLCTCMHPALYFVTPVLICCGLRFGMSLILKTVGCVLSKKFDRTCV